MTWKELLAEKRVETHTTSKMAGVVTDTEATEILAQATAFQITVEQWIAPHYHSFRTFLTFPGSSREPRNSHGNPLRL